MSTTKSVQSKIVVLLSGGVDSAVCLALAKETEKEVHILIFDYGQKHSKEITSAFAIANYFDINPTLVKLSVPFVSNLLKKSKEEIRPNENYVPFRNTMFLSIALGYAEANNCDTIYYGANDLDVENYPDCRQVYIDAMNDIAMLHNSGIRIEAPLMGLKKGEIIRLGEGHKIPWHLTWSCHKGNEKSCGRCPACVNRLRGFTELQIADPLEYDLLA